MHPTATGERADHPGHVLYFCGQRKLPFCHYKLLPFLFLLKISQKLEAAKKIVRIISWLVGPIWRGSSQLGYWLFIALKAQLDDGLGGLDDKILVKEVMTFQL